MIVLARSRKVITRLELTYVSWKRRVKPGPSRSESGIPMARALALVRTIVREGAVMPGVL